MRLVLILVCLVAIAALGWHAVTRGTERAYLRGAPQVEASIEAVVRAAVEIARHPVEVEVSGRDVVLTGVADSSAERDQLLAAARETPLLGQLNDRLSVLEKVQPFRLAISGDAEGGLALAGHVPSRAAEERLLAAARAISDSGVSADLDLAAGAPEGDWTGMALAGLSALVELREGKLELADAEGTLSGTAATPQARAAALAALEQAPMGTWTTAIADAEPTWVAHVFTATKASDGTLRISGLAPNADMRDRLVEAARAITTAPVDGNLQPSEGTPDQGWPDLVTRGLDALGRVDEGTLQMAGRQVSLTASVRTEDDLDRMAKLLDDDWTTDITVLEPTPLAELMLALNPNGDLSATGILPEGMAKADIFGVFPEIVATRLDTGGKAADWTEPLDALTIVLPRFREATIRLTGAVLTVSGTLERGYSAAGTSAALRAALGRRWQLDLDLVERDSLAEVFFNKTGDGIVLSGVLPRGLSPEEALEVLGERAGSAALAGGGEGDAKAWREAFDALSRTLPLFFSASGSVTDGALTLDGRLRPGYGRDAMAVHIGARLAEGWRIDLTAEETNPNEGDRRVSLSTGMSENFRRGFWLPDVDFPVSQQRCAAEADEVLSRETPLFAGDSARIGETGLSLVNRLAAIAVRCLNSSAMQLSIAAHTNSVGNDAENQALSEARATVIEDALVARGVRSDAISAAGYGESRPVATNDTSEGRARNRRIAFDWTDRES